MINGQNQADENQLKDKEVDFQLGDYAVCPGHGVGQVSAIEERDLGGEKRSFYVVKIITNGMNMLIPKDSKEGLRSLTPDSEISDVFNLLKNHDVEVDNSTWNRRHREYMNKIKTGSLIEIADVLRSLFLLKTTKNLSYGERQLLDQCKELIVKEVALSKGSEEKSISSQIDACFF